MSKNDPKKAQRKETTIIQISDPTPQEEFNYFDLYQGYLVSSELVAKKVMDYLVQHSAQEASNKALMHLKVPFATKHIIQTLGYGAKSSAIQYQSHNPQFERFGFEDIEPEASTRDGISTILTQKEQEIQYTIPTQESQKSKPSSLH